MFTFIYSLMTDKRTGAAYLPFKAVLYIFSIVYGLAIIVRSIFYRFGIFRSEKVPIKIISVGNLTLGGTGKTPFVIALSRILNDRLRRQTCVLIRGYGWDEQEMLKKSMPDIPILVGENRSRHAHRAIKLYGSDTAVLDDGFQHWELERDLDIVLIDSRNPFGNGHLFPRGIMREPFLSIKRADVVVFTKVDRKVFDLDGLRKRIRHIKESMIFVEVFHRPRSVYDVKLRKELGLSAVSGKRVILLSSIGDPAYFEQTVKSLGANCLEHIVFDDHHNYDTSDMKRIIKRCDERSFDMILTTEKDAVKLRRMSIVFGKYSLMVLCIEMEFKNGKEMLIDRLHSLYTR